MFRGTGLVLAFGVLTVGCHRLAAYEAHEQDRIPDGRVADSSTEVGVDARGDLDAQISGPRLISTEGNLALRVFDLAVVNEQLVVAWATYVDTAPHIVLRTIDSNGLMSPPKMLSAIEDRPESMQIIPAGSRFFVHWRTADRWN